VGKKEGKFRKKKTQGLMLKAVTRDAVGVGLMMAYGRGGHRRSYSSRTRRLLWLWAVGADEASDPAVYPLGAGGGDAVRAVLFRRWVLPCVQITDLLVPKVSQVAQAGPHLAKVESRGRRATGSACPDAHARRLVRATGHRE
jgi:hypothetical protein